VPQEQAPLVQTAVHIGPLQSLCALFFVQRSTDAEARVLVRTGVAQAAAPAMPTVRSNWRRETRLSSAMDYHPTVKRLRPHHMRICRGLQTRLALPSRLPSRLPMRHRGFDREGAGSKEPCGRIVNLLY
jgi:hypothetical protein